MNLNGRPLRRVLLVAASAVVAATALMLVVRHASVKALVGEDGPIEWASAGFFALAALGAATRMRPEADPGWFRLYVGALAMLCCLSELSFGARLFGWDMPNMRGGGELDGAHDLVLLAWRAAAHSLPLAVTAGMPALLLAGLCLWAARDIRLWLTHDHRRAVVATATLVLAIALVVDLLEPPRARLMEEPLELLAACLLAVAAWARARSLPHDRTSCAAPINPVRQADSQPQAR